MQFTPQTFQLTQQKMKFAKARVPRLQQVYLISDCRAETYADCWLGFPTTMLIHTSKAPVVFPRLERQRDRQTDTRPTLCASMHYGHGQCK